MGHHLSKAAVVDVNKAATKSRKSSQKRYSQEQSTPTIDFKISTEEQEELAAGATIASDPAEVRRIIIKIQLAKMENGDAQVADMQSDMPNANEQKIVNVMLNPQSGTGADRAAGSSTATQKGEASGSSALETAAAVGTLQLHDRDDEAGETSLLRRRRCNSNEGVDYCEVLEPPPVGQMISSGAQQRPPGPSGIEANSCCRSRSSKKSTATTPTTTSKRRCCKCKCRDALRGLRGMLESSSTSSSVASKQNASGSKEARDQQPRKPRSSTDHHRRSTPATLSSSSGSAARLQAQKKRNSVAVPEAMAAATNQLAIWAPANSSGVGDVIIRISSPQFVVEPQAGCSVCTSPLVTVERRLNDTTMGPAICLMAAAELPNSGEQQQQLPAAAARPKTTYGGGVIVHSQIDFMHCLVPDLERIINSSFYWGKMDRYEAERLLEGKAEGTFLLRDSAQEEFLFSVTFRKYGRSLHARIEQSGHKFSFDCHDPCVFTAPTVTGLLEHYKDPSCVMFFEPCLTIPLHRRQTFSLQQLARATIVSNSTYDGINQLELPGRLKSYLKEYHYKQKLRVKPCDAHTPYYANV